jgi:lipid-A-disaccharide synthase
MKHDNSCLIIAGEKSGEDHAMTFMPELMQKTPNCTYYGVGGQRLETKGVELLYHLKDFSGIGISEVLGKIPFYYKALDVIVEEVKKRNTKTAILIDFQGFNLKLAKKLKSLGVDVLYYVAPQAWVWKPWRSKVLEKNVHTLFTILPFEKKWFQDRGVTKVKGVVHPLMIEYKNDFSNIRERKSSDLIGKKIKILLLPGSRNVEVGKLLPIFDRGMSLLGESNIEFEIGIVKSESVRDEHYETNLEFVHEWSSSELVEALNWADLCVAASGTVTLATGIFGVPTIVCYQVSLFTEFVLNMLVPYDGPASLTNIMHDEYIYPELIQYKANRYNISSIIKDWVSSPEKYDLIVEKLKTTRSKLVGDDFSVPEYMSDVINAKK